MAYLSTRIGKDITLKQLSDEFDAVVIATGYSQGKVLKDFANNPYVETAVSYLKRIKENKGDVAVDDNILVVGGGDVSMDICTSLKMLGAPNVTAVVYEELFEFKASKKELEGARDLQVTIIDGYVPTEVKNNTVTFAHRRIPSQIRISADKIVLAVGQVPDMDDLNIKMEKGEVVSKNYRIENSNIFVVGDVSTNKEKTVVGAVRSAKEAGYYIDKYLGGK